MTRKLNIDKAYSDTVDRRPAGNSPNNPTPKRKKKSVATQKKDNAISTEKIVMENVATQTVIVLQTIQILLFHS
jgi:hypothetical protein